MKNFDYDSYEKWKKEHLVIDKSVITHRNIKVDRLKYKLTFFFGENDPKSVRLKYEGYLWKEALPLIRKKLRGWCDESKPYMVLDVYDNKIEDAKHEYIYTNNFIGLMSGLCYDGHNISFLRYERIIDGKTHRIDKYSVRENEESIFSHSQDDGEFDPDEFDYDDVDKEMEFEFNKNIKNEFDK